MEKFINDVRVYCENSNWYCNFEDYKKVRTSQSKSWSEKSFCNWCDDKKVIAVG